MKLNDLIDDLLISVLQYMPYNQLIKYSYSRVFQKGKKCNLFSELSITHCQCSLTQEQMIGGGHRNTPEYKNSICFNKVHKCVCYMNQWNFKEKDPRLIEMRRVCRAHGHCICSTMFPMECCASLHHCICKNNVSEIKECTAIDHECSCVKGNCKKCTVFPFIDKFEHLFGIL